MKKWISGLVVALVSMAATAGFIDERKAKENPSIQDALSIAPIESEQVTAIDRTRGQKWVVLIEDITLEKTLKRWAEQAQFQLLWDTDREIHIPAKDEFVGSFEEALSRVLQSPAIRNSEHPLEAVIYANNPPLVRITRLGEQ